MPSPLGWAGMTSAFGATRCVGDAAPAPPAQTEISKLQSLGFAPG